MLTAGGWREAYRQFVSDGWNALSCPAEFGGQNLPRPLSALIEEMWNGANVAFALCPMLTRGAIDALELRGSQKQRDTYLPKMVSGEWTGTMNLTEPQAGSDLSAVRTRAVPSGDGRYLLTGQKIFITYGEHDLTGNIVHMVLARVAGAPDGVKGTSLFLVPKFLVNADGSLGARNDVHCLSVEHKLGIHASPTCVLAFGQNGGAVAELIGEENRGLEYMFIMMNAARYSVGIEGVGLSERAYQAALAYARDRIQGTEAGIRGGPRVAIVRHPDVRRMLLLMKSQTEAMRALAAVVAVSLDAARLHPGAEVRESHQAFADLMIPVIKGWCTENSVEIASLGVQVHGGVGFIEETGAAQFLRDARITPIYEGTTAIQANDLIGRKLARDSGSAVRAVIAEMRSLEGSLEDQPKLAALAPPFSAAIDALGQAVAYVVENYATDIRAVSVGAVPMLKLLGIVAGGWQLLRSALISHRRLEAPAANAADTVFHEAKIATARFYADYVLSQSAGLACTASGAARPAPWPRPCSRVHMADRYPRRIVCLTEEPTEVLYALGLEERIVGISGFTVRPARARREKPAWSRRSSTPRSIVFFDLRPDFVVGLLRYSGRYRAGADQERD